MTSARRLLPLLAAVLGTVVVALAGSAAQATDGPTADTAHPSAGRPTLADTGPQGRRLPLAGTVIGIDPGHNGRSYTDPSFLDHLIFNGREEEACDTTGTETDGGYTEAKFNFNVASDLSHDLRAEGARVVLTRQNNHGIGPCVTTRAQIINRAHADVAVDIHADGGPADGRGFAILTPVADGPNDRIITASTRLGDVLRAKFLADTGMPISTYDGVDGLQPRDDLAGLNLATEPKVLIECGNMRNAVDARLLSSSAFQRHAATAMAEAITAFLK